MKQILKLTLVLAFGTIAFSHDLALSSGSSSGGGGGQGGQTVDPTVNRSGQAQTLQAQEQLLLQKQKDQGGKNIAFDQQHTLWNDLLQKHVHMIQEARASQVDYKNFDKPKLEKYLQSLSSLSRSQYQEFTREQKLVFLINAYNAFTVQLILDNYPISSIKKIGSIFSSPWKKKFVSLFGEKVSLDDIEHSMIRKDPLFQEPRIHFAVNCASIGCPALLHEAFRADNLEAQLEKVTRAFLKDRKRNRIEGTKVMLSPIFDWYEEDFEKGWKGYRKVEDFVQSYKEALADTPEQLKILEGGKFTIAHTSYNWDLNDMESR